MAHLYRSGGNYASSGSNHWVWDTDFMVKLATLGTVAVIVH